ncbi:MAG: hypothetical protein U0703_14040 [Anaerolineae bacterium]
MFHNQSKASVCRSMGDPFEITCASPRSRLSEPNVTMKGAS